MAKGNKEEGAGAFRLEVLGTLEDVRGHIRKCESVHVQQVAYSTFHDALTQICFGCRKIRTNMVIRSSVDIQKGWREELEEEIQLIDDEIPHCRAPGGQ